MSQSNYIAGSIFLAFLIFITVKGELPAYKAAILGGTASQSNSSAQTAQ